MQVEEKELFHINIFKKPRSAQGAQKNQQDQKQNSFQYKADDKKLRSTKLLFEFNSFKEVNLFKIMNDNKLRLERVAQ